MKALRADFDQPRRGGAPDELVRAGAEPPLRLQPLAGQVALRVHDRLRRPGGAGREHDQTRVLGPELRRGSGLRRGQVGSRDEHDLGLGLGGRELAGVALVADDQLGLGDGEPPAQVVGAQLLRAREDDARPAGSTRSWRAPTRAGCPPGSSRRRPARRRARRARRPLERSGPRADPCSTRAVRQCGRARRGRVGRAGPRRPHRGRSSRALSVERRPNCSLAESGVLAVIFPGRWRAPFCPDSHCPPLSSRPPSRSTCSWPADPGRALPVTCPTRPRTARCGCRASPPSRRRAERSRREPAAEGTVPAIAAPVPVVAFPGGPFVSAPAGGGAGATPVTLSSPPAAAVRIISPAGSIPAGAPVELPSAAPIAATPPPAAAAPPVAVAPRRAGPAGDLPAAERRCGAGRERVRRVAPRRPAGAVARAAGAG